MSETNKNFGDQRNLDLIMLIEEAAASGNMTELNNFISNHPELMRYAKTYLDMISNAYQNVDLVDKVYTAQIGLN